MDDQLSKDDFLIYFGKKLKEIRTSKNLTYRKLAQRCDIDYSHISKIEKGERNIQLSTVLELSKGLEVYPKELFDFKIS
ncbi:helix-turn-helix transcriptional regulator [Christiangramia sp.]|uniref:helix-turn-helix domain-containing protein n=1 Tax=Christiangramia sp. TaxID=1931228 RepID=UPI00260CAA04|nr:helix-turn-helix transcriptional regulator [Christiangramia sp.]|tara:strand:+ start:210 stop:446 length:237 start_codon:yes stop_codon:yes gene_type:complete